MYATRANRKMPKRRTSFDYGGVYARMDAQAHREIIAWVKAMGIGHHADAFLAQCESDLTEYGHLTGAQGRTLEKIQDELIAQAKKHLASNAEAHASATKEPIA